MNKRLNILGKHIPVWLLVLTLIAAGTGAAAGTVLRGEVIGEMPVTVSQALLVGKPVAVPFDTDWTDVYGHVIGVIVRPFIPR